jgi:rod shape-determining protein MreC
MTTMTTRQTFALVVLFVVTSLAFIQLDGRRALDPVKEGLQAAVSPALAAFGAVNPGRGANSDLERQLEVVMAERDQMAAQIAGYKALEREIDDLRRQAGLVKDQPTWTMLPARVLASDPSDQELFMTINKGSRDGVGEGMAVVARGKNFVGQVTEVWESTARVTLAIDLSSAVGAKLESGPDGIVYGMWLRGGRLEMRHLNREARPQVGEHVVTTDNEAISTARIPGGLILGRIGAEAEIDGDSKRALVIPLIDFEQLEVVTVVLADEE